MDALNPTALSFSDVTQQARMASAPTAAAARLQQSEATLQDDAAMRKVAEDFAGLFIGELFKTMDEGNTGEGFGMGGNVEKMWREMSYEEYGKQAARTPGNPLTETVYRSINQRAAAQAYAAY
ncbi:MAG: rod-binding protein [Planctomycetota bacterium]|jgi:Rod binding domain-containing protein